MTNDEWLEMRAPCFLYEERERMRAIAQQLRAADSLASVVDGSTEAEAAALEAYKRSQK